MAFAVELETLEEKRSCTLTFGGATADEGYTPRFVFFRIRASEAFPAALPRSRVPQSIFRVESSNQSPREQSTQSSVPGPESPEAKSLTENGR